MKKILISTLMLASPFAFAINPNSDWHFSGALLLSSRSLEGTLANQNQLNSKMFGNLLATGNSTGVGQSNEFMYDIALQYKKLGFGITHLPTSFHGEGFSLVGTGTSNSGAYTQAPLKTDVDVTMTLANVYYNLIQDSQRMLGVGVGFGQTNIDVGLVPGVGQALVYQDKQPFGFINFHFSNSYQRFIYGFSVNWIHGDFGGSTIDFSDYKINLGYRISQKTVTTDFIAGFRDVNFAVTYKGNTQRLNTDLTLAGPFLGLRVTY